MGWIEWIWRMLPDRCQRMPNCSRRGVRGNENVIHGVRLCDDCHSKLMELSDAGAILRYGEDRGTCCASK